jgi:hypothetical protein
MIIMLVRVNPLSSASASMLSTITAGSRSITIRFLSDIEITRIKINVINDCLHVVECQLLHDVLCIAPSAGMHFTARFFSHAPPGTILP